MRGVILREGVVVNAIKLPDEWTGKPDEWQPEPGDEVLVGEAALSASIGMQYDAKTGTFSRPVLPSIARTEPPADLKATIDAAVEDASIPDSLKAVLMEWKKRI